ncbi:hypothetical protein HPB52_010726 [Rhipicephalus sanguineus]|uniref:Uncharacterized protein n=1 Tax=Rhipicephalus sanguineus TaxID=34632 RepID=A0A9D4T9E8_RHISA|nr:hypothetical protein HPB52_010726 [Rhipicephalus sanguineus]
MASPPESFACLETQQKCDEDAHRCDVPAGTTDAASNCCSGDDILPTREKTLSEKCEAQPRSHSPKPSEDNECEGTNLVQYATSCITKDEVIVGDRIEPKALADSYFHDIVRKLREGLQVHGMSHENELLEALSPSEVQLLLEVYGSLPAFVEQRPEFGIAREDLRTFAYFQDTDREDQDKDTSWSCSSGFNDDCSQHEESGVGKHQRSRYSSSSSSSYESAVEEQDEEHCLKDTCSQVPSPPRYHSRCLGTVHETSDAEVQTQGWDLSRFLELQLTLQNQDSQIVQLKERLETLRQRQVGEVEPLRLKIEQLLKRPSAIPPQSTAELNNSSCIKEQTPVGKNGTEPDVNPTPPRSPLPRNLSPLPRPDNKLRAMAVDPRPLAQVDEKSFCSEKAPPMPEIDELPDGEKTADPCTDVESIRSNLEKTPPKSKMARQISKIVRMVQKKQPHYTEHEIRSKIDHMRNSQGGLSGMTLGAIVELLLDSSKPGTMKI